MNPDRLLAHFDRIAEAPDALPRLRRFILDLAVRGKLVEQDPNDEPASALLKRIAAEKARLVKEGSIKRPKPLSDVGDDEVPFEPPPSWEWARLGNLASYIQRGKSPKYSPGSGIPVVSQKCVQWSGLELGYAKEISAESLERYEEFRFLRARDLLWNSTGTGTIGRVITIQDPPEKLVCDSHVTVVRILACDAEYVRIWLMTDHVYGLIEGRAAGSTNQVELTASLANNQPTPLPPLAEQKRIVAKVDELMALCDRLEAAQREREEQRSRLVTSTHHHLNLPDRQAGLPAGEAGDPEADPAARVRFTFAPTVFPRLTARPEHIPPLRQTILNLAVRGQLVPQDPTDEPASELLKRIAAERHALIESGTIKKGKPLREIATSDLPFEVPGSWKWIRLGSVILDSNSGWSPKAEDFPKTGNQWGVLKVSAVSWGDFRPEENKQLLVPRYFEWKRGCMGISRLEPVK
jgi:type I restriction enzyme, S subunit